MNGARSVTAQFVLAKVVLRVTVRGRGRVVSRPVGIACPKTCNARFLSASLVRLAPKAAKGFRFAGWSGACRGRAGCSVRLQQAAAVSARFVRR
jgi:hypothetical protein